MPHDRRPTTYDRTPELQNPSFGTQVAAHDLHGTHDRRFHDSGDCAERDGQNDVEIHSADAKVSDSEACGPRPEAYFASEATRSMATNVWWPRKITSEK